MNTRPSSSLRVIALSLALALVGCGDDGAMETSATTTTGGESSTSSSTTSTSTSTSGTSTDATAAGPVCGDGIIDEGEACDGDALGDATCVSEGFVGGDLSCDNRCKLDTSACAGELMCNDEALMGSSCTVGDPSTCTCAGCVLDGMCTLEDDCVCGECAGDAFCGDVANCANDGLCDPYNEGCACADCASHPQCLPVCGDGVAASAGGEACDGDDLGGQTCVSAGFDGGGVLACDDACGLNTEGCLSEEVCGDGFVGKTEVCEGDELGGETCVTQGFADGELACSDACELDTSKCIDVCGDGMITGLEECDGDDVAEATCVSLGFVGGGLLVCGDACLFDTAGCLSEEVCGDGFIGATELCDGDDFGGETCISQGFPGGGFLACVDQCAAIDTANCIADEVCGDNFVGENEACDGPNLGGETCVSQGFAGGGPLTCDDACAFVTDACIDQAVCGDTFIGEGEECDGANLNNQTCASLGLGAGKLGCSDTCEFDTSKCNG
ncbi:MAG: hypothetical protein KC420_12085 [Myxococcales bacterium]|nr:hypothetical protein [Myxococcales bacterium]MCB9569861.1 hypothetical protein [Myxococcales bacterium]MCB9706457.1 hypothetical protein [Myxococcales bacterium]